ncbi:MAG: hypothetical protein RL222_1431, partial [Bacteroidota bacterium]
MNKLICSLLLVFGMSATVLA